VVIDATKRTMTSWKKRRAQSPYPRSRVLKPRRIIFLEAIINGIICLGTTRDRKFIQLATIAWYPKSLKKPDWECST